MLKQQQEQQQQYSSLNARQERNGGMINSTHDRDQYTSISSQRDNNDNDEQNSHDDRGNDYGIEGYNDQHNELHHEYEMEADPWFRKYFAFIERNRQYIVIFWCIILFISLFIGPSYLTLGDDSVKPPHGSTAWLVHFILFFELTLFLLCHAFTVILF